MWKPVFQSILEMVSIKIKIYESNSHYTFSQQIKIIRVFVNTKFSHLPQVYT